MFMWAEMLAHHKVELSMTPWLVAAWRFKGREMKLWMSTGTCKLTTDNNAASQVFRSILKNSILMWIYTHIKHTVGRHLKTWLSVILTAHQQIQKLNPNTPLLFVSPPKLHSEQKVFGGRGVSAMPWQKRRASSCSHRACGFSFRPWSASLSWGRTGWSLQTFPNPCSYDSFCIFLFWKSHSVFAFKKTCSSLSWPQDAALIFAPGELGLRGADDAHVTATHFAFKGKLLRGAESRRETKVVVTARLGGKVFHKEWVFWILISKDIKTIYIKPEHWTLRQLLAPLTGANQKSEGGLRIGLCGPRIKVEFATRCGMTVCHEVPLLETLPFLPEEPSAGPHAAALCPGLLARVMLHCVPRRSGSEEVTLGAAPSEGLRVKSEDLTSTVKEEGSHRTEVLVQMSDLEACSLDANAALEVRFPGRGLRDFAIATDLFIPQLENLGLLTGSALLELRFGEDSGSVVCSFAVPSSGSAVPLDDFQAVFMVCIRETTAPQLPPATPQQLPATAASPQNRRPQPRQGAKRRAVEVPNPETFDEFEAFPESGAFGALRQGTNRVIDLTQSRPTQPAATQATEPARSQLQLFTAEQKAQILHSQPQREAPRPVPTFLLTPTPAEPATQRPNGQPMPMQVPNGIATVPNGSSNGVQPRAIPNELQPSHSNGANGQAQWWQGRPAPPAPVMATLSPRPALASHLAGLARDVFDSDDELIGADPDEIAFARGDQEEEAPDWFDCERLWWQTLWNSWKLQIALSKVTASPASWDQSFTWPSRSI